MKLKMVPPGAPNKIILSPLRGAQMCEVTRLWLKYSLLYRKQKSGWKDRRSDGRQLLGCSLLRRNYGSVITYNGCLWLSCKVPRGLSVSQKMLSKSLNAPPIVLLPKFSHFLPKSLYPDLLSKLSCIALAKQKQKEKIHVVTIRLES